MAMLGFHPNLRALFSSQVPHGERVSASRQRKGERGLWQRRYWEHTIADEDDLRRHIDYIHYNPMKHGYVRSASEWPHSSIHRYIRAGDVAADWGVAPESVVAGERV